MAHWDLVGVINELKDATSAKQVLTDRFDLEKYARDETENLHMAPDIAVLVRSEEEVAKVMAIASKHQVPVTPRGGGTGLSGGALPAMGGVSLSLEKMNSILEIDEHNMMARVQPGVITYDLHQAVEEKGLYYPPDPASYESCTLGGNLAEDAGGPRAVKYGVTSAYVKGLRAVLASGETIATGGKLLKNVAGFNLTQLLVGSEGTLGVITEATLRLIPKPRFRRTMLAPFDSLEKAAMAVPSVIKQGVSPAVLEFMEQPALLAAKAHLKIPVPHEDAKAHLLVELDGFDEDLLDEELERAGRILMDAGAVDILLAQSPAQQEKLWKTRRSLGEAVKSISAYRELDTCVPRIQIPRLVKETHKICDKHQVRLICYGHAGDGNLHMNILIGDLDPAEWEKRIHKVTQEVFDVTCKLGGAITGEHGVGLVAKPYLKKALGQKSIDLMKGLKKVFDPHGILNPSKIFD